MFLNVVLVDKEDAMTIIGLSLIMKLWRDFEKMKNHILLNKTKTSGQIQNLTSGIDRAFNCAP